MPDAPQSLSREGLLRFLFSFLTEQRRQRFAETVVQRTRHITVVVENIFQSHNASAIIRSCECLGIQDIHVIENRNAYKLNPDIVMGSSNWITLRKYGNEPDSDRNCLNTLREKGYMIVATSPHIESFTPETLPLDKKIALVFGAELEGISREIKDEANHFLRIPMAGFTESFNVSVSAGICLYTLVNRLKNSGLSWQLSHEEQTEILIRWAKNNLKNPETIEKEYYSGKRQEEESD